MARPAGIIGWGVNTEGGTGAGGAPGHNPSIREWPCDAFLSLANFQAVDPAAKAPCRSERVRLQSRQGRDDEPGRPPKRISWLARDGWPLADDRVKQVKEANDIVAVIEGYLELRPAGGARFKGLCPFHDDHNPSLLVDQQWQNYRCWSCNKYGDVITFVQEYERVGFAEALELLARRAGITLEKSQNSVQNQGRAAMLDVIRWAAQQFHECLLDSPLADEARRYVAARGLTGETVRRYGLGYAPRSGEWLVQRAEDAGVSLEILEKVGLIAPRTERPGYYDRFRERVQFPIRDTRGQTVGFGGRILPTSPLSSRGPKYYNSTTTPLFNKSEHLYGIDLARHAAGECGYLAIVEGYTDVLMAHQMGVGPVVATMGTALNARHVQQIRRFAPRVVLVFDADAGGDTGVDRALEIFAGHDVDLAIATLPEGLDPCDLLVQQGAEALRRLLESAVDALEFKLNQVLAKDGPLGIEDKRRAVDAVLGIIALAPPLPGQAGAVKTQLMINHIAQRLGLKEENLWARLRELRAHKRGEGPASGELYPHRRDTGETGQRTAKAAPEERQLLELLLADPELVAQTAPLICAQEIAHPGLRELLEGLYALQAAGDPPTLDLLRPRLDNVHLAEKALKLQDIGRAMPDRPACLRQLLAFFQERRLKRVTQELHTQLNAARDPAAELELLRQLQNRNVELGPGSCSVAEARS
jgi:DNA primase